MRVMHRMALFCGSTNIPFSIYPFPVSPKGERLWPLLPLWGKAGKGVDFILDALTSICDHAQLINFTAIVTSKGPFL
jgi:hypothetical protein